MQLSLEHVLRRFDLRIGVALWLVPLLSAIAASGWAQGGWPATYPEPTSPPSYQPPGYPPMVNQPPAWQAAPDAPLPAPLPPYGPVASAAGQAGAPQPAPQPTPAPAAQEQWVLPHSADRWLSLTPPDLPWEGSFQLGLNGSTGNDESFSLQTGGDIKRTIEADVWKADVKYVRTVARGVSTQHNSIGNLKWEHLFDSPWTVFGRTYGEYDEFKAFDFRLAVNAGFGYRLVDTETTKLKPRIGAGWSREFGGTDDEFVPEAVFGGDFELKLTDRQKLTLTVDYFPNWTDFADYRIVSDLGWELLLDEAAHLSLKLSAIDRYDSTPQGRQPNDLNYALLLLWKL